MPVAGTKFHFLQRLHENGPGTDQSAAAGILWWCRTTPRSTRAPLHTTGSGDRIEDATKACYPHAISRISKEALLG
jgi:hypothetical protein